jgi:hypothetical protein
MAMKVYRHCTMKTKGRNTNSATLCQCTGVGRQVLKRSVRRQQNSTLIVGREGKYEKMKLFPAVS